MSNRFVYSPSVHRLLELAANVYDASTNGNDNLLRMCSGRCLSWYRNGTNNDIFIVGYVPVTLVTGYTDPQLDPPYDATQLSGAPVNRPILDARQSPINIYGVPWIIGAKKGLPSFNQLYLTNTVQVTRNLLFTRPQVGKPVNQTNQMFSMAFNTGLGISFWNSYTNDYNSPRQMSVYVRDLVSTVLVASNKDGSLRQWSANNTFYLGPGAGPVTLTKPWPRTVWSGNPPFATVLNPSGNATA